MRRWRNWSVLVLALALVAAACTGGGDDAGGEAAAEAPIAQDDAGRFERDAAGGEALEEAAAEPDAPAAEAPAELGAGGVTPVVAQTPADLGRQIIFTANLTVSVPDVARAGEEATRIVESLGGFLFGQDTTGSPEPRSILTFRISPDNFQDALTQLSGIGELRTQTVSADDVTERVVDLESRITTAEASVERLRGFLQNATKIEDIAQLEAQLLARETELETLRGQLRTIRDRVDLATITLTLTEAGVAPAIQLIQTAYPGAEDSGASCPGNDGLVVEEGSEVTLCFEIRNAGDAPLTGFELTDSVLEIDLDDLLVIFGDPAGTLQPGQNMIVAYETQVDRTLRTQTRVQAVPLDAEGNVIPAREVSNTQSITVFAEDPGGLPGFRDGLQASWNFLQTVWGLLVLLAGSLLPFIWVIPLAWWLWRRRGRRAQARAEAEPARAAEAGAAAVTVPAADAAVDGEGSADEG